MDKLVEVYRKFNSEEGNMHRYSLSYSIFLAIFPTVISMMVFFRLTYTSAANYLEILYRVLPDDLIDPLVDYVGTNNYGSGLTLVLMIVMTSNLACGSLYSFMLMSKADEKFECPNLLVRIKAFGVYLLMLAILNVVALVNFYHYIPTSVFNAGITVAAFYILFRSFSFKKQAWHYGLAGSIVTSATIIAILELLFTYTSYATNYRNLYGPLSSILLGMLSVYYIASAIYAGYLVNRAFGIKSENQDYKMIWFYSFGNYIFGSFASFVEFIKSETKKRLFK
ncbi:MAG: YhjD/YihY/BrkB family envelope integrity protein [Erysipelotrichaceae bacterium]|nr:YhjD/YihY/BrkB family envelope integrity protein [Erysipelotrichaceae bacterium]